MRLYLSSLALTSALIVSEPLVSVRAQETRVVSGTVQCKMAYQVLLDADGKALKGRLYPEYSDCATKLLLKYPGLNRLRPIGQKVKAL